ncbi:hypothetical protein BXY82_0313 [Gelidibacter sediminis]|uniref:HprK-related kinase B n=1 Tax=Gelidibacter sediminis TaxID=1608710 RepID=A0A4R7Q7G9_9FLAO|nr:hypothetical protein [Gelidibacter sediminis]TDU42912.1 hypothetical protein BXY82_0313 [Gelidibacter sediminis]
MFKENTLSEICSPRFIVQINDSFIFWFERSNQYLVVSKTINDLLGLFFETTNKSSFLTACIDQNISLEEAHTIYDDIHKLIKQANTSADQNSASVLIPKIATPIVIKQYLLKTSSVIINYGTLELEKFIHPQWAHALTKKKNCDHTTTFDVFKVQDHNFLFVNKKYIKHYHANESHVLAGQINLQIINALYAKEESDWMATFHASTVCNDQEAIMIIGASGNGKSTLSAVLMASGIDVLADDFTPLLAENKEVYRFPSGISVKVGAFNMLKELYPDFEEYPLDVSTSKNVPIRYIPPIKNLESGTSHLPCKKIVYVHYNPTAISSMEKISTARILETLITESWLSPLTSNVELFLDWIKDLQCYELIYSDNEMAVSKFNELFGS